ncbi:MAG: hypothetical protein ACW987_18355 [Candidatus Thorarchaeota archaeon]|jgi:hypothetical protein
MGMFNWVSFAMDCPECGRKVGGFQTKDGDYYDLDLSWKDVEELTNFYSYCMHGKDINDDGAWSYSLWLEFYRESVFDGWLWQKRRARDVNTEWKSVDIWRLPGATIVEKEGY